MDTRVDQQRSFPRFLNTTTNEKETASEDRRVNTGTGAQDSQAQLHKEWAQKLRKALGDNFCVEKGRSITPEDFRLQRNRCIVTYEGKDDYCIHVCPNQEVLTLKASGPPDYIMRAAEKWVFEKVIRPTVSEFLKGGTSADWKREIPRGWKDPTNRDFLDDNGDYALDRVIVRARNEKPGYDLFWLSVIACAGDMIVRVERGPVLEEETASQYINQIRWKARSLKLQYNTMKAAAEKVYEAFPNNKIESDYVVTSADFKGKSPYHFFVRPAKLVGVEAFVLHEGEALRMLFYREEEEDYPSLVKDYLFRTRFWPLFCSGLKEPVFAMNESARLSGYKAFMDLDVGAFEIDRMYLVPDSKTQTIKACTIDVETVTPKFEVFTFEDLPTLSEKVEALCEQCLTDYFAAMGRIRALAGENLVENSSGRINPPAESYRVKLLPSSLKVELWYRDRWGDADRQVVSGFSEEKVQRAIEAICRPYLKRKALWEQAEKIPGSVVVKEVGHIVYSGDWDDAEPYRILLCPLANYKEFKAVCRRADGTGKTIFVTVDSVEKIAQAVETLRDRIKEDVEGQRRFEEEVAKIKDATATKRHCVIGDHFWCPLHPFRVVIRPDVGHRGCRVFYRLHGCSEPRSVNVETLEELPKTVQEVRKEILRAAPLFTLCWESLSQTGKQQSVELPPPPKGVEIEDLITLAEGLKPGLCRDATVGRVEWIKRHIGYFIRVLSGNGFKGMNEKDGDGRVILDMSERMRTMVLHIVEKLKDIEKEKKKPEVIYWALRVLTKGNSHCNGRTVTDTAHVFMELMNWWEPVLPDSWHQRILTWVDEIKIHVVNKMVVGFEHNANHRNYIFKLLDERGVKVPPSLDINFSDNCIDYMAKEHLGKPNKIAQRFQKAFKKDLVDYVHERVALHMKKDHPFREGVMDALRGHVEKSPLTSEEKDRLAAADKDRREQLQGEVSPKKATSIQEQFRDAKNGILQDGVYRRKLVTWDDENYTSFSFTRKGALALLHELGIIILTEACLQE